MNKKYFHLCLKRNFKIYPTVLLVTLFTIISIALACLALLHSNSFHKNQKKINIAVVGNIDDTYLNIGLDILQKTDSSNLYLEWQNMDEDDAIQALKKREIDGYLYIPKNYIENIYIGNNTPAKYVMLNAPEGFGSILSSEITKTISDIIIESQVGMYSMVDFSHDYHPKDISKNDNSLMIEYMNFILNRHSIYNIEYLGIADNLSFIGYYTCSILMILMLLWGISCNKILSIGNKEYNKILNISGINAYRQVTANYIAYLIISLITFAFIILSIGIGIQFFEINSPELSGLSLTDIIGYIIKILPVIFMITMMQFAIYEAIPNTIASILLQFIFTIVLGYISGCFYPNTFFPDIIKEVSTYTPVGAGFSYMRKSMIGWPSFKDVVLVLLYIFIFFEFAYYSRKYKITGDTI